MTERRWQVQLTDEALAGLTALSDPADRSAVLEWFATTLSDDPLSPGVGFRRDLEPGLSQHIARVPGTNVLVSFLPVQQFWAVRVTIIERFE